MIIDHSNIRPDILSLERNNAKRDPDGQVYPWRGLYPLAGQVVYHDGQLWYVVGRERGAFADRDVTHLVRVGPPNSDARETLTASRRDLRPVSWTQDDESVFGTIGGKVAMARSSARDKLIHTLAKLAEVSHSAEPDDVPPENCFQFPDDVATAYELRRSSVWGWCCVKTTAEYAGFKASTYLGGCSYESADAFVTDNGEAQTYEACAALLDKIIETKANGQIASNILHNLRTIGGK